jgi:hypothetical protein
MSRTASVFAGPFAMWPEESVPRHETGELLDTESGSFSWYFATIGEPGSKPNRDGPRAVYFTPNPYEPPLPGGPKHVMCFDREPPGEFVGMNFLTVNIASEVEAFRKTYGNELAVLTAAAGVEPVIGWGVIYGIG